jgi:hypothetical protein
MAVLTSNSLDSCTSIPCFLPGGTRMTFNNSVAPTSWTKNTSSHNNKALRLITGTRSPGPATGTVFSSVLSSSRAVSMSINSVNTGAAIGSVTATGSTNQVTPPITVNPATIGNQQMASHSHLYDVRSSTNRISISGSTGPVQTIKQGFQSLQVEQNAPSPTSHTHTITFSGGHSHSVQFRDQHNHGFQNQGPHGHPLTSPAQSFAITYVDVIVASKNSDPVACSI